MPRRGRQILTSSLSLLLINLPRCRHFEVSVSLAELLLCHKYHGLDGQ